MAMTAHTANHHSPLRLREGGGGARGEKMGDGGGAMGEGRARERTLGTRKGRREGETLKAGRGGKVGGKH